MKNNSDSANTKNNTYLFFFNEKNSLYNNFNNHNGNYNFASSKINNTISITSNMKINNNISGSISNHSESREDKKSKNHSTLDDNSKENKSELLKKPLDSYHLVNCRSVTDFEKIEEIGEGTYGRVCKFI
jgi:hypothetical protein